MIGTVCGEADGVGALHRFGRVRFFFFFGSFD